MPLYTADALILRTYKLGEADRIVVFLTRDRGKKRGVAKGARRTRSRFLGALEPLTRASVAYFERERRELVGLNYAEALQSPLALRDPGGLGHVAYFAELIDEWAAEADPTNEKLFRLGAAVLGALVAGVPVEPVARYFEYWLLRLQGVYPSLAACHDCGGALDGGALVAPRERVFVCRRCGPARGGALLSGAAVAFLRGAGRVPPERLGELTLAAGAARELEAAHRMLIAAHLEKELRSARVLREMRHAY
jgi:DNA repair protein RecO (recombination protein O)